MKTEISNLRFNLLTTLSLLIGWALRTINLGSQSLWQNEIISYRRATADTLAAGHQMLLDGNHAPLYELGILRPFFRLVGHNEFLHRFPSGIFGILAMCVVYKFAKEVFGKKVGLLSLVVMAINPIHIYYSREGRMYALLAFVVILAIYFLQKALYHKGEGGWFYLAGYAFAAAASMYTHYYAGLTLLAVTMAVLGYLAYSRDFLYGFRWLLANLGAACLFLPWLPTFFKQLRNDPVSHIARPSLSQMVKLPAQFFTGYSYVPGALAILTSVGLLLLCEILLIILYFKVGSSSRPFQISFAMIVVYVATLGLAYVVSILVTPIIGLRYFIALVPLLSILIGAFIGQFDSRLMMVGMIGFIVINSYFSYDVVSTVWRKDYGRVAEIVSESNLANEQVILYSPGSSFWLDEFDFYFQDNESVIYELDKKLEPQKLNELIDGVDSTVNGVWIVQTNLLHEIQPIEQNALAYEILDQQQFENQFFFAMQSVQLTHIKTER